ncbi:hypothetical protein [Anaerosolibacter sp.]|uniref:hypothetical protein n=1 Tax=Anaerosolibacter sp. TaxID=1872527 RepID=UPI00261164A2|nr:hypothetical protein [Anaerosolibacter sp.]
MNEAKMSVLDYSLGRYDYSGAYRLLKDIDDAPQSIVCILDGCRYAANFDFKTAFETVRALKDDKDMDIPMKKWLDDMESLAKGVPDAIFSELLENTRIQLENERYIDFVSRIYRLKEAILKYVFIRYHIEKNKVTFSSEVLSKQSILKILRKKYKIFNPNLSYAITAYLQKYHNNDWRCNQLIHLINSDKMNALMDLRNASIAGHGFKGIERKDLIMIYGSIDQIIEDFVKVFSEINVHLQRNKYDRLNRYILEMMAKNK